jgi:PEP-CTERM motif
MLSHCAHLRSFLYATVAAAGLMALSLATPVFATPPPSLPPSVTNTAAGILQQDGTYLWQYSVFAGQRPSLSHWVLDICEDVFDDIIPNSVVGGPIEFRDDEHPDPTTGAFGLKFDSGGEDGQTLIYSFNTTQDWRCEDHTTTAVFKAGRNVTTQEGVIAPCCETDGDHNPPPVPEPGTLALLTTGCAPLLTALRRRWQSHA